MFKWVLSIWDRGSLPIPLTWVRRRETWQGETKGNNIRLIALLFFTANEMLNYHVFHVVDRSFHVGSLLIITIWFLSAMLFHAIIQRHWLVSAGPYLTAGVDVLLLTWMLFLGDGPQSPLAVLYFLIVALAGLRLDPRVVIYTAAVSAFGYLSAWDFAKRQKPEMIVSKQHLIIVEVALILSGAIGVSLINRVFELLLPFKKGVSHDQ